MENKEETLRKEIQDLREKLWAKENELCELERSQRNNIPISDSSNKLTNDDISRYSRQIIIPEIGVKGQVTLLNSSVLIIGAGGLGCPSALYLVGAGVGHIGLVDYDDVEANNLHRQLLHTEASLGHSKVDSAAASLQRLNGKTKITRYKLQLDSQNALDIVRGYDVVVDATDNVATRYLLNDACVLTGRPLVSGSALQWEGQLTVYHHGGGPCYRCMFPVPPPPETVTNCGDGGVLGAVPGVIGVLQALETIKVLLHHPGVLSGRMLVLDGADMSVRCVRLRGRNQHCSACGNEPTIKSLIDYEQFCGAKANDKDKRLHLLDNNHRVTVTDYKSVLDNNQPHLLVDVRSPMEFEICSLPGSVNLPLKELKKEETVGKLKQDISLQQNGNLAGFPVFVVCRRGNDSQKGALFLQTALGRDGVLVKDLVGGLHAWARDVDSAFPVY